MKEITQIFNEQYHPQNALVVYQHSNDRSDIYIESFEFDQHNRPINAHPLSLEEIKQLAKCLKTDVDINPACFTPKFLLPENILFLDNSEDGMAVWHTPSQKRQLLFDENLFIPSGCAFVPPLLWMATKKRLSVFALKKDNRPNKDTALYYAPFFNVTAKQGICMGTVKIKAHQSTDLDAFIHCWEAHFYDSYFTHLIDDRSPVKGNLASLWKSLVNTDTPFPVNQLKTNGFTIKDVINGKQ